MIKVSVCIPVYGVEKYIERCARSLFNQTMKDEIEFIFVNDCTKDKSIEILQKILLEYPNRKKQVKILHHSVNKGLTGARNTALATASGDYIIHCDSDYWVDPDLYEVMYNLAILEKADIVCCPIIEEKGNDRQRIINPKDIQCVEELFKTSFNSVFFNSLLNKMFSKKIAKSNTIVAPENITMAEDLLRTTQMLLITQGKLVLSGNSYYHYSRDNQQAATANFSNKAFNSSYEALSILITKFPPMYKNYANACRGQILFSALRVKDIDFNAIMEIQKQISFISFISNKHLSFIKKVLVIISLFSFSTAQFLCKILEFIHRQLKNI